MSQYPTAENRPDSHSSLFVVMFTKLRMSVDEAIEEFGNILKDVYANTKSISEARTSRLRGLIEDLLARKNVPIDAKMYNRDTDDSCQR